MQILPVSPESWNFAEIFLCIYSIQAIYIIHMIMVFGENHNLWIILPQPIIFLGLKHFTNSFKKTFIREKANCKWKKIGKVDSCQSIHHQLFWSYLAICEILMKDLNCKRILPAQALISQYAPCPRWNMEKRDNEVCKHSPDSGYLLMPNKLQPRTITIVKLWQWEDWFKQESRFKSGKWTYIFWH